MVKDDLQQIEADPRKGNALKFIIGGIVIVAAIIYLMVSSLQANIQYFLTVLFWGNPSIMTWKPWS